MIKARTITSILFLASTIILASLAVVSCDFVPTTVLPHSNSADPEYTGTVSDEETTPTEDAPAAPASMSITSGSSGTLTVSWPAVAGADSYKLIYNTVNTTGAATEVSSSIDADKTDTNASITGLSDGTLYYLWVSALNTGGESAFSPVTRGIPVEIGTDHHGGDLIISSNQNLSGTHYNVGVFQVTTGTTLTLDPYDGSDPETGSLTVYADSVIIDGTIDASAAGHGGGGGGGGGAGGGSNVSSGYNGGIPGSGTQGGSGGYNGNALAANAANGASGGNGGNGGGLSGGSGGTGGSGGNAGSSSSAMDGTNGTPGSQGTSGGSAAYSSAGSSAVNEIIGMGCGGGAGGGGGGGGGLGVAAAVYGGGGAGGGAGGNGGGMIRLFSFGSFTATGIIRANGSIGGNGGSISGASRAAGPGGNAPGTNGGQGYDNQGSDAYGRMGAGGAAGRNGGAGSGGGVLLKGVTVNLSGATINSDGASSNDGVIKIFYEGTYTAGTYSTGTDVYVNQFGE